MSTSTEDVCYPNSGRGVCVIVANFYGNKTGSHHLPGYMVDHKDLKEYFEKDLEYDVVTHVGGMHLLNLSSCNFRKAMHELQVMLNDKMEKEAEQFDKFVMFVLSHGGQAGLFMCAENSNGEHFEIDKYGNAVCISVEEIINCFTHDNIPRMKGIPKCFVMQACRGRGYVQPAGLGSDNESEYELLQKAMENPSIKRANIFVTYATLDETFSYVHSKNGSWLVSTILKVMNDRCMKDDVFGIMTKVIGAICENMSHRFFPVNEQNTEVRVVHNNRLCPILIFGKLIQADNEADKKYKEGNGMPLYPHKGSYTHFAPYRQVRPLLTDYMFSGTVKFMMAMQQKLNLHEMSAENLKPFADPKYFEIYGILKKKASGKPTEEAAINVHGDMFEVVSYGKPKCGMNADNINIFGYLEEENIKLTEAELHNREASLYINNEAYHVGKLEKYNGVWGLNAPIYQLPIVSSTLTKKMYFTEPEDEHDEVDRTIEYLQKMKLKQKSQKSKAPKKSPKKDEEPKTDLETGDIEPLPAGTDAKDNLKKERKSSESEQV